MVEFLEPEHCDELDEAVATITGVEVSSLTLSERHIKEYEPGADRYPLQDGKPVTGFSIEGNGDIARSQALPLRRRSRTHRTWMFLQFSRVK
jgi:hypothetical protein